jgi:hypothetical protein
MKRIFSILRWFGRHKFFAQRVRDYLVVAQLAMVADIWIRANGYTWRGILSVSIPLSAIIYIIDRWGVYPGEVDAAVAGMDWLKELNEKLDKIIGQIDKPLPPEKVQDVTTNKGCSESYEEKSCTRTDH